MDNRDHVYFLNHIVFKKMWYDILLRIHESTVRYEYEVTSLQHEVALAKYEYILGNNLILIIILTNSEPVQNTGCQALLLACLSQFIGRAIKQRSAIEKEKSKKCNLS